jgi:CheY-like chemotaxis protein
MKKIVVADDDFRQRVLYVDLFRQNGFEVMPAEDGLDAWEQIQKTKPDLVFTGILMPRMTGFELIENLRKNTSTNLLPIIIFSHLGREEDREKAKKLGIAFMVKGYDSPAKILEIVQGLVNPSSSIRAVPKPRLLDEDPPGVPML